MNFTGHAVEAVRQLGMIPYTICYATGPDENLSQSIRRKIWDWELDRSDECEDHRSFTITACAMSIIAAKTIINILDQRNSEDSVDAANAQVHEALLQGHAMVAHAVAQLYGPSGWPEELERIREASSFSHRPVNSLACSQKATDQISWFQCHDASERPTPCLPCPALVGLATPDIGHEYTDSQDSMAKGEPVGESPFDSPVTAPMPVQAHPAVHALSAIKEMKHLTTTISPGSDAHRNLAWAATAATECIDWLWGRRHYNEDALASEPHYPMRPALELTATILGGHPYQPVPVPNEYPKEGEVCQLITVLPERYRRYVCSEIDRNLERSTPCRQCPLGGRPLHRSSVITMLDEIGDRV